jgi:hypothetical protein
MEDDSNALDSGDMSGSVDPALPPPKAKIPKAPAMRQPRMPKAPSARAGHVDAMWHVRKPMLERMPRRK